MRPRQSQALPGGSGRPSAVDHPRTHMLLGPFPLPGVGNVAPKCRATPKRLAGGRMPGDRSPREGPVSPWPWALRPRGSRSAGQKGQV